MKKIKTDHPFTKKQLVKLNQELEKISNVQIGLRGTKLPGKNNYTDIQIKHNPFNLDVFLCFVDVTDADRPSSQVFKIDHEGLIDYRPRSTMNFHNFADKIYFFNTLTPINFEL